MAKLATTSDSPSCVLNYHDGAALLFLYYPVV